MTVTLYDPEMWSPELPIRKTRRKYPGLMIGMSVYVPLRGNMLVWFSISLRLTAEHVDTWHDCFTFQVI